MAATEEGGREIQPVRSTGPSLVNSTQLGDWDTGRWVFGLYPDAAEGGGSFHHTIRPSSNRGVRGEAEDPERAKAVSARRSAGKIRRYVCANRLNRLGTLTYDQACRDPVQARRDIGLFFRSLRSHVGRPFPYLWVPEWHPGGHGLHLHFVVGRFIPVGVIKAAWGRGIVHIKLIGDVPVGKGALGESRIAARYLAKYVAKAIEESHDFGRHRFDVAQGFAPKVSRIAGTSVSEVIGVASDRMGAAPGYIWLSRDEPEWFGPPVFFASWNR